MGTVYYFITVENIQQVEKINNVHFMYKYNIMFIIYYMGSLTSSSKINYFMHLYSVLYWKKNVSNKFYIINTT